MSDTKRVYDSQAQAEQPVKVELENESPGKPGHGAVINPQIWKVPCSLETILRLIERVQAL